MAESHSDRPRPRGGASPEPGDWKHLARVGSLLVVVLGALLMGALLQRGEEDSGVIETPAIAEGRDAAAGAVPTPATAARAGESPAREVAPLGTLSDLARRASADFARLPGDDAWMLQLAAYCDAERVSQLIRRVDERSLHVLPVEIGDQACFRICWGPYASRAAAVAGARGLPQPLRSLVESSQPRSIASLSP